MLDSIRAITLPPVSGQATRPAAATAAQTASAPADGFEASSGDKPLPKKWTVLVYAAADNNLYANEYENLRDLETIGSTRQLNVVAQFDAGGCGGVTRRHIERRTHPDGSLGSPVIEDLGYPVNMSDPKTLADFVKWGMEKYPAEHTMLIINDHGDGWRGCVEDRSASDWMSLPKVREGLEAAQQATGKKLDIIGFDACLMGMAEVTNELQGTADYMVASQETEGNAGWPYSRIMSAQMLAHLDARLTHLLPSSARDVAIAAVQQAATTQDELPTMAAYDLSKAGALTSAIDHLGTQIVASPITKERLDEIAGKTQTFDVYKDLYHFASGIEGDGTAGCELNAAAGEVKRAIDDMVIAEQHSADYPNAHGVSIELNAAQEGYGDVQLAQRTAWTSAQDKMGLGGDEG